jgi:hypothetical protein
LEQHRPFWVLKLIFDWNRFLVIHVSYHNKVMLWVSML